jgi:hypothetical protein
MPKEGLAGTLGKIRRRALCLVLVWHCPTRPIASVTFLDAAY